MPPCPHPTPQITKMWYQLKVEAVVDSMMTTNAEVKTTLNVLPGTKAPTAALPATPDQDRPQVRGPHMQPEAAPCSAASCAVHA